MNRTDSLLDFRSDTVTRPTEAMRQAMAAVTVIDDAYDEDEVVQLLEQRSAKLLGKEAALFVPTGTMANTIAVKLLTHHGQEVICDSRSHVVEMELAMMAWFSGVQPRFIHAERGLIRWEHILGVLRAAEETPIGHWQGAIVVENTHNFAGGTVYPLDQLRDICDRAHLHGLKVHMDGARLFNAAAYLGCDVAQIVSSADTVMFCLSKGLGAPVGSILAASAKRIENARRYRHQLGGRMKGAAVLAAAGLIALETQPQNLHRDHENAQYLAKELSALPAIRLDPESIQTNIVVFDITDTRIPASEFSKKLQVRGLLANGISDHEIRMVTHRDVSTSDCSRAIAIVSETLAG